jgi:hypothetical protein
LVRGGGTDGEEGMVLFLRRLAPWSVLALALAAVAAPGAFSAKPTITKIPVDVTEPDEFLTEECEFPVTTSFQGHVIIREFEREGTGVVEVFTINVTATAMANGKTYTLKNVGADVIRRTPDGDLILMIIGQAPFDFTGVLKINLTTDEVIHEPQHSNEGDLQKVCAALSA